MKKSTFVIICLDLILVFWFLIIISPFLPFSPQENSVENYSFYTKTCENETVWENVEFGANIRPYETTVNCKNLFNEYFRETGRSAIDVECYDIELVDTKLKTEDSYKLIDGEVEDIEYTYRENSYIVNGSFKYITDYESCHYSELKDRLNINCDCIWHRGEKCVEWKCDEIYVTANQI